MSKGRMSWKTFMKSGITSVLFLLHVLLATLMVEGRIEILSWPVKQIAGDCETGSDSKINWQIEKVLSGKKKEQLNKDKCKLPCRQKCFSKHRMWDYWVNQWSYDFLHPAQMWPCNDTEPMEKSHPEKWLFRGWGGGVDISHYVAIGLKVCDFKTGKLLTLQLACRWTQLHHWYSMQQEMPKVLDWYR